MLIARYTAAFFFLLCYSSLASQNLYRFTYESPKMGTTFKIIFYASDSARAAITIKKCWERVDQLNTIFSDYQADSEVTKLSRSAGADRWINVSGDLWKLMRWAHTLSLRSNGAFDITIGPLSKLWRRAIRHQEVPDQAEIIAAKSLVNFRMIEYDTANHNVKLLKKGMKLDFGGIAKGYAVDQVYDILRNHDISRALVDGGGDIYLGLAPPNQKGWKVKTIEKDTVSEIESQAIASSGSKYKYVQIGDKKYSHIVDPNTGMGIASQDLIDQSIIVVAKDCMTADALASALSVLSPDKRQLLLRLYPESFYYLSSSKNE